MAEKNRVSRIFNLGKEQPSLDFVDVDVSTDTSVFISPRAMEMLGSEWGDQCVSLVQNFFETVLELIKAGKNDEAEKLLATLKEPNETHLGLSNGTSRGRALGDGSAHVVWSALSNSAAAQSGLLKDLEDTVLLVSGIGVDIVSDITTNIIRRPLIEYTQRICLQEGIPLQADVNSGPLWNPQNRSWESQFTQLPMTQFGKLVLVPKAVVRRSPLYDVQEYFRHYLLDHLQKVELEAGSALVTILKNGKRKVHKSDLIRIKGSTKPDIARETIKDSTPLERYKAEKATQPFLPLDHDDLADVENTNRPDWDALLTAVTDLNSGNENASAYEKAIESLLTALFYPDMTNPINQHEIHDGRKRIDITYTNMAQAGFFSWISKHYPSARIFVECKNYGSDIANNELDQISSRFSPSRGQVGLVVSRTFVNKAKFLERCRDTAKDRRGFVIALDDQDLIDLVKVRRADDHYQLWPLLQDRFNQLVN